VRRLAGLIAEAIRMAVARPVSSTITGLIVAGVCGVILSTTGQSVQAERQVLGRIDDAGTRSVVVTDTNGSAGIRPAAVDRISHLSGVEWVVGFGSAADVHAAGIPGGNPAAVRAVYGTLPPEVVTSGWDEAPGTVLVGPDAQTTLGLDIPAGGVATRDGTDYAVVGWFDAVDPLGFLNRSLLAAPDPDAVDPTLRTIQILVDRPEDVAPVADAVYGLLDAQDPTSVGIQTSETLAQIRQAVQGELGRYSRRLVTLILAVGLILVGLNVYGSITTARRDYGRRRALGASRPDIITLVTIQTVTIAAVGTVAGSIAGGVIIWRLTGSPPDAGFTVAVAVLAVLTAGIAAIPPAMVAAWRDPVSILRVP